MVHLVASPLMTRVRCSVEPCSETANILRECEIARGLAMSMSEGVSGSLDVLGWRDYLSQLNYLSHDRFQVAVDEKELRGVCLLSLCLLCCSSVLLV